MVKVLSIVITRIPASVIYMVILRRPNEALHCGSLHRKAPVLLSALGNSRATVAATSGGI